MAAHGDWVGASGTRMTFDRGLGAVRLVEQGVGACSPCAAPPTPVRRRPWSSHRHLRVWWPVLRVSGVSGCNRGPWWPVAAAAPAGGDRRRRGRWWAALATCGGGVGGGHGGGLKERGATSFDLMWRRLNFHARARAEWLCILCNNSPVINYSLA